MASLSTLQHRFLKQISVCFFILSQSPASFAQVQKADSAEARARAWYQQGNEAFRLGDYEQARKLYQKARQEESRFDILCNLGRVEALLGDDALALHHLDECLKEYPPEAEYEAARAKFYALREEVRKRCHEKTCHISALTRKRDASLAAEAAAEQEDSGHAPRVQRESDPAPEGSVGEEDSSLAHSSTGSSARLVWGVSLAAAGVLVAGGGTGFWLAADAQADDARAQGRAILDAGGNCETLAFAGCAEYSDAISGTESKRVWAQGLWGAGGALLIAGALVYFLWPEADAEQPGQSGRVRMVPQVAVDPTGRGGFLGVQGSF